MMKSQETTKLLKKKTSFMIDDLLRNEHAENTSTTDHVNIKKSTTSTASFFTSESNDSTETSHDENRNSRGKRVINTMDIVECTLSCPTV